MEKGQLKGNKGKFKKGDKVKTRFREVRTVLRQIGCQVFIEEESNSWYHPSNLRITDRVTPECKVFHQDKI